ncbi:hypothetical protein [Nocardiopsis sp. Huas11]|uniref:hypothetical protein n=1 Tax=Nocardiopsis sp. Huas11 TaxID=2183912 RepID=UPI00131530CF|nr:hypothetical protein [Nocardiopsis sp. Huas11]
MPRSTSLTVLCAMTAARAAADVVGVALIAPLGRLGPGESEAVRAVQALLRHALHS